MVDDLFCLADEPYLDYEQEVVDRVYYENGERLEEIIVMKNRKGKVVKTVKRITRLRKKWSWRGMVFSWEVSYEQI